MHESSFSDLIFLFVSFSAGIVSLLDDPQPELKSFALKKLMSPLSGLPDSTCAIGPLSVIDVFWAEISDSIQTIEQLYEDPGYPDRELAALVASKVYYHLGSYDDSLFYALGAGKKFDVTEKSEYVDTMIGKFNNLTYPYRTFHHFRASK